MVLRYVTAALASLFWLAPASSNAAPLTFNLTFSGTGFVDEYGTPAQTAPFPSIAGTFTVTFDPTLGYENQSSGLVVQSFTGVPVSSPITFSYFPSDGEFYLGGSLNSPEGAASGTNDFLVTFNLSNPYAPTLVNCTDPDNDCGFANGTPSVLVTTYTSSSYPDSGFFLLASGAQLSVPEPGTFGIVLVGLAAIGVLGVVRLLPGSLKRPA